MRLPQIECNVLLDEFPTVMETRKAVQQLSSGKAPGVDAINAEVYAFGVYVGVGCYPCQRKLRICFTVCGERRLSRKNIRMHP